MFAHITGIVLDLEWTKAMIEIRGIWLALDVFLSPQLITEIHEGSEVSIPLHHHITEAGQTLFGFSNLQERSIFRKLLSVSGVWGKTAQNILGLGTENILRAIELNDDTLLASVSGIGKKTAQKIIVELKGSIDMSQLWWVSAKQITHPTDTQLMSSLIQMGYDKHQVESIIATLDPKETLQKRTIQAIQQLSR
jgi:holliday junction DNA helicase RuvA